VNSGKRTIFSFVAAGFAIFASSLAGRAGEDGSGAMWIASDLLVSPAPVQTCSQHDELGSRELVFEIIVDEGQPDWATEGMLGGSAVIFEWNEMTGELTFASTATAGVFSDLTNPAIRPSSLSARSCGSN
jgi:hypothetical protein